MSKQRQRGPPCCRESLPCSLYPGVAVGMRPRPHARGVWEQLPECGGPKLCGWKACPPVKGAVGPERGLLCVSVRFSSVTQLCLTLCDPMDCRTPGLPVHHQLPELTQTHVHRVSDAIQPSHPLSSPSPLPSVFPNIRVFSSESALRIRWPKYWSFSFSISPSNEYSGLISFRTD